MVRVMGAVDIPHTGVTLAGNAQYFTGKPWAASAQVSLPQGDQRILLEQRGTRRLSAQTLVDVRLSKSIGLGGSRRAEVFVDLLNVLNDTAEESLANDNQFSPTFGQAAAFVDPRRAMFGVRLNVGR